MSDENLKIAENYFTAMQNHDLAALEEILAPPLHFKDPLNEHHTRDAFLDTATKLFSQLVQIRVRVRFASQDQVFSLYDMIFSLSTRPATAANLMTFEKGQIQAMEVVYDARPFAPPLELKRDYVKKELGN